MKGLLILKAIAVTKYCILDMRKIAVLSGHANISKLSESGKQTFLYLYNKFTGIKRPTNWKVKQIIISDNTEERTGKLIRS